MNIKVISKVDYEGLTLSEVKNFLKVDLDYTAEDSLLTMMLKSAIDSLEKYCNIAIREKALSVVFEDFDIDEGTVLLPVYPCASVTNVYLINQYSEEAEVTDFITIGDDLKEITCRTWIEGDKIKVNYKAGYGLDGADMLPEQVNMYLLQILLNWYNDRDSMGVISGTVRKGLKSLSYRSWM